MAMDLTQRPAQAPAVKPATGLSTFVRAKIAKMMTGKKADEFVTNVVSLVNNNPALAQCDQTSLLSSCLQAQSLSLSLNQGMGQAWIVPFKNRKLNRTDATFQIGYKGYIQLAVRSGQYRKLNVLVVKEGELVRWNPMLEEIDIELIQDEDTRQKAETIGYFAMFEYTNGFRKCIYWSKSKMMNHALQYSQAFRYDKKTGGRDSFWSKDFDSMAIKTMLRQLISHWGIMSVEMQNALNADGRTTDGEYIDGSFINENVQMTPTITAEAEAVNIETGEVVSDTGIATEQQPNEKKEEVKEEAQKSE